MEKRYVGLFFKYDRSWEIVPQNWLIESKSGLKCFWPRKPENVVMLARSRATPMNDWTVWDVERTVISSGELMFINNVLKQ